MARLDWGPVWRIGRHLQIIPAGLPAYAALLGVLAGAVFYLIRTLAPTAIVRPWWHYVLATAACLFVGTLIHEAAHTAVRLANNSYLDGTRDDVYLSLGAQPYSSGPTQPPLTTLVQALAGPTTALAYGLAAAWLIPSPLAPMAGLTEALLAATNLLPIGPSDGRIALTAAHDLRRSRAASRDSCPASD